MIVIAQNTNTFPKGCSRWEVYTYNKVNREGLLNMYSLEIVEPTNRIRDCGFAYGGLSLKAFYRLNVAFLLTLGQCPPIPPIVPQYAK